MTARATWHDFAAPHDRRSLVRRVARAAGCAVRPLQPLRDAERCSGAAAARRPTARSRTASSRSIRSTSAPADVRDTLAKGPTPRIMLLHGGIYPVHLAMESFGRFLVGMGYPGGEDPRPGRRRAGRTARTRTPSGSPGIVAWYYEQDGMPPMLIGHSQGGMQAVKVLHVLERRLRRRASRSGIR